MDAQSQGKEFCELFKVPKVFHKVNPPENIVIQAATACHSQKQFES